MGFYINPREQTKEEFLSEHGMPISRNLFLEFSDFKGHDKLPVCLMNNPTFSAAGIAFSRNEAAAFANPDDNRPKQYFLVPRTLLNGDVGINSKALQDHVTLCS